MTAKHPCGVSLRRNGSLSEPEHGGFSVTVRDVAVGEDYGVEYCGGTCPDVQHGKLRVGVTSDQTNRQVVPRFSS